MRSKQESRLQKWWLENQPSEEMLYKEGFKDQIIFVRDTLSSILARTYDEYKDLWDVPSTHRSKSVILPVYHTILKDPKGLKTLEVWMRNNFYNWNVSVNGNFSLDTIEFYNCFDDSGGYTFCEGMEEWKFGKFSEDISKFTICVNNDYDLYFFFRIIKKVLKINPTD
jgi:hypothetical protein